MPVSKDVFRAALTKFASGVTVVTTKNSQGDMHGITVSAFCSVSLEPPLILVCIEKTAGSHHAFEESGVFIVNILGEGQRAISNQFASSTPDKFSEIEYIENENGIPIIMGCIANLECSLKHVYDGGDHTIFVGQVERTILRSGKPIIYNQGIYDELKS